MSPPKPAESPAGSLSARDNPTPKEAPKPAPAPAPKPASTPAPKPASTPAPAPAPKPASTPAPTPAPKTAAKPAPTPAPKPTAPAPVGKVVKDSKGTGAQPRASKRVLERIKQDSPSGLLRTLRMVLLITAAVFFSTTAEAHDSYKVIIILEICIITFFIIVYMLTLRNLLLSLDWPLLDLLNCIISAVFLLIVGIVALREKKRNSNFYTGGGLCIILAALCLLDAILITLNRKKGRKEHKSSVTKVSNASKALVDTVGSSQPHSKASSRASSQPSTKSPSHQGSKEQSGK